MLIWLFFACRLGNNNVDDENGENNEGQERGKASKKKNIEKEIIMHAFENVCSSNNIRKYPIYELVIFTPTVQYLLVMSLI